MLDRGRDVLLVQQGLEELAGANGIAISACFCPVAVFGIQGNGVLEGRKDSQHSVLCYKRKVRRPRRVPHIWL